MTTQPEVNGQLDQVHARKLSWERGVVRPQWASRGLAGLSWICQGHFCKKFLDLTKRPRCKCSNLSLVGDFEGGYRVFLAILQIIWFQIGWKRGFFAIPLSPGKVTKSSSGKKWAALSLCLAGGPIFYTGWAPPGFQCWDNCNVPV